MIATSKKYSFDKLLETKKFTLNSYEPNPDSRSGEFKKHHYRYVDKFDSYKEEYEVAKYIDSLDEVTTWIRNIARDHQNAFWLQTSNGKFYPDFVIKLANGKMVVAEYKGEHLRSNDDSKEKEIIGKLWASKSDELEFVMLYKGEYREALNRVMG